MSRYGFGADQFFDGNRPLSGGKLYFYETNSSTPKATYSNLGQTIANTWPVVLDGDGRQGDVFFTGSAKLIITSAANVQIDEVNPVYPVDSGGLTGRGPVYYEQFITSGATDGATLAAAIEYCTSNNIRHLHIDTDITVTSVPDGFYNVIPIGTGSITGAFRRWVYPERVFTKTTGRIIPELHLAQFKSEAIAGTPKVVFFGDSLLTYNVNALGRQNTLAHMIETKFVMEYPDVTIDFINRSIGGQSWIESLTVAGNVTPDWYTDDLKNWIDYVEDEVPDVVVVNLGMNDAGAYAPANIEDFVAHLATWTPVPDIIFCTGLVPTLEATPAWQAYSNEGPQNARNNVAGHIRTFCLAESYGFIDVNRACNIVRDGFDTFDTYLKRIDTELDVSGTGGNYIADVEVWGYKFAGEIAGTTAQIADVFDGTNGTLAVLLGNINQGPVLLFIRDLGGGVFVLDFYDGTSGGGNYYLRLTTAEPIPTSTFTLYLEVRGNVFLMRIAENGTTRDIVRLNTLRTMGAGFEPRFGYAETNYTTGPFSEVTFDAAMPELYLPTLTNDEVWGVCEEVVSTKLPYGGNGINHPSSLGTNMIYGKALDDVKFR